MAILEVCANSHQSAINAERGGAHRIELCQNLEEGGTTPSIGLIKKVKQRLTIPVHVLIRPRTGDFVYTDDECDVMLEDIRACRDLGCEGIAVGVLTSDGGVDMPRLRTFVEAAGPEMAVTFHRAFDDCRDMVQALEDVVQAGCKRVLTSGGADSAVEGRSVIAQLSEIAKGRIVVMPGAGITAQNLKGLAEFTGAVEYHASAKTSLDCLTESRFRAPQWQTGVDDIKALVEIVSSL